MNRSIKLSNVNLNFSQIKTDSSGNTSIGKLLLNAAVDLQNGSTDVAIVGSVDSLISEESILWLKGLSRFKSSSLPAGLICGEAAGLVMLTKTSNLNTLKLPQLALLDSVSVSISDNEKSGEEYLGSGESVAEALVSILVGDNEKNQHASIFTDQNGESVRAKSMGNALVKVNVQLSDQSKIYSPDI